jgi:hypothetical protein
MLCNVAVLYVFLRLVDEAFDKLRKVYPGMKAPPSITTKRIVHKLYTLYDHGEKTAMANGRKYHDNVRQEDYESFQHFFVRWKEDPEMQSLSESEKTDELLDRLRLEY